MDLKLHPDAQVEKNPSDGHYVIHNAGFRQDITKDQLSALPDAKFTTLENGLVRIEHEGFGVWHWAQNHFNALFRDANDPDSPESTGKAVEGEPALVTGKTPEEIEAENKANADEANSLLGNAPTAETVTTVPDSSSDQTATVPEQ